ncbi:MAG: PAS domain-containing protein, partial [Haliscomenobacter sp.]
MKNAQTSYSDVRLRFDAVIETATDGIVIIDEAGKMELVNPAAAALFGYAVEDLIGCNINMLMPSPHREKHDTYVKNYLTTGIRHIIGIGREVEGLKKNGDLFPFRLSISEVLLHDRRIFTGIIHDLTEQKNAERALQREKERAQRYLDVANSLFIVINRDETVALINKKGTEILGYSEMELVGQNWFDLCVPMEARQKRRQSFQSIMAGRELRFDYFENPVETKYGETRLFAFRNSLLRDA